MDGGILTVITLVGTPMAKVGFEFIYAGPIQECKDCRVKTVCFNLQIGKKYKITAVRDKSHECKLNEDTTKIVEVEEVSTVVAIPKRLAIEGSTISMDERVCDFPCCEHFLKCHPFAIVSNSKLKVVKILGKIDCDEGNHLILAEVR